VIETQYADGTVSRTVYDANGRTSVTQDRHVQGEPANGSRSTYDIVGRVVKSERLANVVVNIVDDTVGKKIRSGEKEWIPYLLVVGEQEKASGKLSVRSRADRSQRQMDLDEFAEIVRKQTAGFPFRPLPLPQRVSRRPVFHG